MTNSSALHPVPCCILFSICMQMLSCFNPANALAMAFSRKISPGSCVVRVVSKFLSPVIVEVWHFSASTAYTTRFSAQRPTPSLNPRHDSPLLGSLIPLAWPSFCVTPLSDWRLFYIFLLTGSDSSGLCIGQHCCHLCYTHQPAQVSGRQCVGDKRLVPL